jgi:multidrug resistance protein
MSDREALRGLWVLMATVFVDMIGFLMVLPLLPFYAERLGANATVIGALVAAFAFAQLLTAPFWGRLSDRYGRRPMILIGLGSSALAYVLFGLAGSVWVLFLSRLVQGAGGGTTGVVQAYVSDTVAPKDRAKALGWISAATSAGVMLGPALGSLSAGLGTAAPGFLAAGLCVLNMLSAWRWLPEPKGRSREERSRYKPRRGAAREVVVEALKRPAGRVSALLWIYAGGMMAFMAMNAVLALFLERRYGVSEQTIGWFFVYIGGISLLMRSIILGPVVSLLGEVHTLRLGALSLALGMGLIPFTHHLVAFGLAVMLVPIGTALLFPATTSLVSSRGHEAETGMLLGVQQSFGGVARLIGPLWAGAAFDRLSIGAPFWLAGGVVLALHLFAMLVRPEPHGGEEEGADSPASEEVRAPEVLGS